MFNFILTYESSLLLQQMIIPFVLLNCPGRFAYPDHIISACRIIRNS